MQPTDLLLDAVVAGEQITRADVGLRSERGPILLAIMLSVSLVAIDATILATAVPAIVADLGGFAHFPWLFSIYLLAQAVSVPIYGKFSDQLGRKPIMLIGIAAFALGSIVCGLAWSMPALIVARAVQGLGAGAVQPTSMTMIGDLYSVAERAKVQGYVASVWAASSVVGPTLGGLFSDYLSWRWIFYINIPLAAVAAFMVARRFHESAANTRHTIDYRGAVLLAVGTSLLILGLLEGGVLWDWASPTGAAVLATAALVLAVFALVERRAVEPILPGWVLRRRILNSTNLASLTIGVIVIGLTSYVPLYAQGVLGTSAVVAGFALAALTLGWPISASLAGRVYLRLGFRATALIGSGFCLLGAGLLLLLGAATTIQQVAVTCFVMGLGLGLVASPTLIAAQSTVPWERRGVVTGTNMFARSMGSAVGVAVFGAIANASLTHHITPHTTSVPAAELVVASRNVFLGAAVVVVVLVVGVFLMPRDQPATEDTR